jgi:Cu-Zn family superoxide dismutase
VHEKGDCSAPDASSAGPHLNPTNAEHGDPQGAAHHAGDMPNAKSDASGMAEVNAHVSGLTLGDGGANDVVGKAVVVHEKADDYKSQPAGNSGARVACGVVTAATQAAGS